jgi:hypothetical protein
LEATEHSPIHGVRKVALLSGTQGVEVRTETVDLAGRAQQMDEDYV